MLKKIEEIVKCEEFSLKIKLSARKKQTVFGVNLNWSLKQQGVKSFVRHQHLLKVDI